MLRNLDAINPGFAKPRRFIPSGAVLPFLMGAMCWAFTSPVTVGIHFSREPLSLIWAAVMCAAVLLFFLPKLFGWDWNVSYFGVASFHLASASLLGVIPWLTIVLYSKADAWMRIGILVAYALPVIWWCFRFVQYYTRIMADENLRNSLYVVESDAIYYCQKNDNWLLKNRFRFSQVPHAVVFLLALIAALALLAVVRRVSVFLGIPFMNLFMVTLSFPFVLLFLGVATRGYLVFYHYPREIRRRTGKKIYVDMVTRTVHQSRPFTHTKEDCMYLELINLLTCKGLDFRELKDIAEQVASAPDDPEYEWAQGDASVAIGCELAGRLYDFAAISDKADEMHEQIQDMFDGDFPDFPGAHEERWNAAAYSQWLDAELSQRAVEEGGYDAVMLDTGADENMNLFVVYRKDTPRILELADALGLRMYRPVDYHRDA